MAIACKRQIWDQGYTVSAVTPAVTEGNHSAALPDAVGAENITVMYNVVQLFLTLMF